MPIDEESPIARLDESIITGFQLTTNAGPLCGESMQGVCFTIESIKFSEEYESQLSTNTAKVAGQVISAMREACKQAFLDQSPRLLLAMYSCEILATCNTQILLI